MHLSYLSFALLAESGTTPWNAVIAGLAFLNTLGIFGLIYHAGRFVGDNARRWEDTEKRLSSLDQAVNAVHSQEVLQAKTELMLSTVTTAVNDLKAEIKQVRKRSHDLSNVLTRLALAAGEKLSSVPELQQEKEEGA